MPFSIVRDEIARQVADVVVVPANAALRVDGGAGLAVGRVAGLADLQSACDKIGGCDEGDVVVTPAFAFPAKALVHVVGPVWDDTPYARETLRRAYDTALRVALEQGAQSIALPLISSGARGCPADYSLHVALERVEAFLDANADVDVRIVVFGDDATVAARKRFSGLASYIDSAYVASHEEYLFPSYSPAAAPRSSAPAPRMQAAPMAERKPKRGSVFTRMREGVESALEAIGGAMEGGRESRGSRDVVVGPEERQWPLGDETCYEAEQVASFDGVCADVEPMLGAAAPAPASQEAVPFGGMPLSAVLDAVDASFSTTLLAIIDSRGLSDAEVYRRANISRQHFSKMRSNPYYQPTKKTVFALAIALELSVDETRDLLERAGFAFSRSSVFDLVIEWFIAQGKYNIFEINEALYAYDQPLLA